VARQFQRQLVRAGQNIANTVIAAMDPDGLIHLYGAVNPTHVVIDVQGFML
jgi:hypothetical protein